MRPRLLGVWSQHVTALTNQLYGEAASRQRSDKLGLRLRKVKPGLPIMTPIAISLKAQSGGRGGTN